MKGVRTISYPYISSEQEMVEALQSLMIRLSSQAIKSELSKI